MQKYAIKFRRSKGRIPANFGGLEMPKMSLFEAKTSIFKVKLPYSDNIIKNSPFPLVSEENIKPQNFANKPKISFLTPDKTMENNLVNLEDSNLEAEPCIECTEENKLYLAYYLEYCFLILFLLAFVTIIIYYRFQLINHG